MYQYGTTVTNLANILHVLIKLNNRKFIIWLSEKLITVSAISNKQEKLLMKK